MTNCMYFFSRAKMAGYHQFEMLPQVLVQVHQQVLEQKMDRRMFAFELRENIVGERHGEPLSPHTDVGNRRQYVGRDVLRRNDAPSLPVE